MGEKNFQDRNLFVDLMGKGESPRGSLLKFSAPGERERLDGEGPEVHVAVEGALQNGLFRE